MPIHMSLCFTPAYTVCMCVCVLLLLLLRLFQLAFARTPAAAAAVMGRKRTNYPWVGLQSCTLAGADAVAYQVKLRTLQPARHPDVHVSLVPILPLL